MNRTDGVNPNYAAITREVLSRLSTRGLRAEVVIHEDEPMPLAGSERQWVLGSTGRPVCRAVAVVLSPRRRSRVTAWAWAEGQVGADVVRAVCDERLSAHLSWRLRYAVPTGRRGTAVTDPPIFGLARVGFTLLRMPMKRRPPIKAHVQHLLHDVAEEFGLDPDDPRFAAIAERHNAREPDYGKLIPDDLVARLEALEELVATLLGRPRKQLTRAGKPGAVPLNKPHTRRST